MPPIDSSIPLRAASAVIDPSPGINSLANAFQYREQKQDRAQERELRTLQIANEKFKSMEARDQLRLKRTILGAAQLDGYLQSGDVAGAKSFLQTRRAAIEQARTLDPDIDTRETDEALQMLESGNVEQLKGITGNSIKLGQALKFLEKPEKVTSFSPVYDSKGNIVAQKNDATGEVKDDPRAPKLLSPEELKQKMDLAQAGKSDVNVKVETKTGESLAKEIGPMMAESKSNAQGAVSAIDTARRIRGAISDQNVSVGPTATVRNSINQFAQLLGVAGKDTEEKLVNTRNVIRGLSQFALAARKQLKGQGQVSDYEGKLIQRAEAGQVEDFTLPELKDFIGVTEKLAKKTFDEHKRSVGVMKNNPSLEQLVPFYDLPDMAEETTGPKEGATASNPRTGQKVVYRGGKWQPL